MDAAQLMEIYRAHGVRGVNDTINGKNDIDALNALRALESEGFEILWHYGADGDDRPDAGVVVSGPDDD